MAKKKYDLITELYAEAVREVTSKPENWMAFLRSACRNYRLPFDEQLLVHVQRPDATAVLEMEDWNRKFGRWVKRGSKGIAVIDKNAGTMRLKYYFDASDTKEGRYRRLVRPVPLWEVSEEHRQEVQETLANAFGVERELASFAETIQEAASNAASDNLTDYMGNILSSRENSFLEEMDEYNVEIKVRQLLSNSVAFMVMVRCGIDTEMYLDTDDFQGITDFNTPQLANLFGAATSDVSEMALSQLADTVRKLQLEGKKNNRTFAGEKADTYNESTNTNPERSGDYENDRIQPARRISPAEYYRTSGKENSPWEIRIPEKKISSGTTVRDIHNLADARETQPAPDGNTGGSTGTDGADREGDGRETERDGRTQGERSDDVGGHDEQFPSDSGGNRDEGTDLQLEWYDRSNEDKSLPFFGSDSDIKSLFLATPHLKATKEEICSFYEDHEDNKERTEYIKSIFNNEYTEVTLEDGRRVGYKTYQNVLHLWEGKYLSRTAQAYYDWRVIAKYFEGMRLLGELWDRWRPIPTVGEQFRMLNDMVEEKSSAFSFPQEIIDYALTEGSNFEHGKYRIYSYFLQEHTIKEKADFLKDEYGTGGRGSILAGTGIREEHNAKGLKLIRGFADDAPELLLKWGKVAKRIDELMAAGRYMTKRELEYIPEYEKGVLTAKIYNFYYNQPEEVVRPYPMGAYYYDAIKVIRPQLDEPKRVEEILKSMEEVLEGTADFARNYQSMQKTYRDLTDYKNGNYSLFTPLSPAENKISTPPVHTDRHSKAEQAQEPEPTGGTSEQETVQYDLQVDTIVYIGLKEYRIELLSPEMAVLRDEAYPLFTEEMPRAEFERKVRENPANDHLQVQWSQPELPAENNKIKTESEISQAEERETETEETISQETEIPQEERNQYHITDDGLGQGTPKEKFRANITAIQTLKKCEDEGRLATPDEQKLLSGYVGWGGLSDAFDETKTAWSTEYLELKNVLTPEEYTAARESTLTAFYTLPVVIRSIYDVLDRMGFSKGNILEPSMGIGNFFGMLPEKMRESRLYGVELDDITGRIAKQLYPNANIQISGFEQTDFPDDFFDIVIGNVPFGNYKVSDKRYDRHNLLVHDYFFAKSIDKVRKGGVIAMITSNGMSGGTFDKRDSKARRYIARRCDLLGAVRLPSSAFEDADLPTDILFFQKREYQRDLSVDIPDWVQTTIIHESDHVKENGEVRHNRVTENNYFLEHPEMVLGKQEVVNGQFGPKLVCLPTEGSLEEKLKNAVSHIQGTIESTELYELVEDIDTAAIPADLDVKNYSYTLVDDKIYYRENSRMKPVELSVTGANRVKGMIAIRDLVRELIACQTEGYPDTEVERCQKELNRRYDEFRSRYGLLNARANSMVFSDDNSYPLLCSLEILKEDGTLERKADMFTKRTIRPHKAVEKVDTAAEALSVSLSEKARVDMEYMCSLTGKSAEDIEKELAGVIFRLPNVSGENPQFVSEDEYLSGNVRQKLKEAKLAAKSSEVYQSNAEALEKVQPKDLTASEINVRLGATWISTDDIADFMFELLETPNYERWHIKVCFSKYTGEWQIEGKSRDKANVKANNAYGTHRASAYKIIEDSLNLRDVRIYDYVEDDKGKTKAVLNKKETSIAQGKQDLIKQAFQDWIWKDPERRQRLTDYYNERFNAIRPREYDGSHLKFYGMNPEIKLRQHQKNGAARIIYGGNTLLAYVVGAGKTYTMVAAAMESKRLGLCNKSMIVVPNHIIEQFAAEWLQLYPAANILVATKKDFETKNRKKFCARIATSDIDAVIIGHSQFEKIPLSVDRQRQTLERQLEEITNGIIEAKSQQGQRFTVKQLEKSKKTIIAKLKKLNDQSRKDNVVTFEELGIDRLFVDEADGYKNLYLYTKMRNVGGIAQTEAQKSSDMFMKCRYLDEITGGRGVIFATGTPVSNSMVELYTMQRYLQYNTLVMNDLQHFDAWASTYGETVTAIELAPEGTGYRLKTRFAKFYNLPELMTMFREVADIQTADMLNLPVPEAEYRVITVKPSEMQKKMVEDLGNRAERVRNKMVDPRQDNMLLITNDGRKLALDQRLANEMLPDEAESKVNACVEEVYRFWEEGREKKLTQLLFCDLSTPKNDGTFSVYNDVRDKLLAKGIPEAEIAFIHNANTETKKKDLFSKVRRGAVRILMGSTFKMGAGTNVQDLIVASHDLDCPWRPRDLEQRAGRTIRQGNKNAKVDIIRYVTEGTFDAYLYQVIENKQKFISQIMTSKSPARTVEDIDEVALSYAEIKALAAGNPHVKEKMDLDIQVSKLQLLKQSFLSQKYEMEDKVTKEFPRKIKKMEERIVLYQQDIEQVKAHTPSDRDMFPPMQINGTVYQEKKDAGWAIIVECKAMKSPDEVPLGTYRGLSMELSYDTFVKDFIVTLQGKEKYHVRLGEDIYGNITRIDNEIEKLPDKLERCKDELENLKSQLETAKVEAAKEFPKEQELAEKAARLGELNALLDVGGSDKVLLDEAPDEEEPEPKKKEKDRER